MFFLDQKRDFAIARLPRCGSNTITMWLSDAILVENDDTRLLLVARRVAFVRNPFERLKSAFSLFYWMDQQGKPHRSGAPADSWESFVDFVLYPRIPDDPHWKLQTEHVSGIPNIYHKFEDIEKKYELYQPGPFSAYQNRTTRRPTNNYRFSDLFEKYRPDIELYLGAD